MVQPDISIAMINTNNREIALQCLESVFATRGNLDIEIIVVNNACQDGSREAIEQRYPEVKILETQEKQGFSTNNNLALQQASGRYYLLLNDDTIVLPGALQAMLAFMDQNPQVGSVGAALLNRDGTSQYCYGRTPHPLYDGLRPLTEILLPDLKSPGTPVESGWVCGACLMARAEAAHEIGPLDTRFDPLYSEEIDWCYRFIKAGWKVYHLPQAQVIHLGEVSKRRASKQRYEQIYAHKAIYYRKNHGEIAASVYKISLWMINFLKALTWLILWGLRFPEARQEFEVHWNIVRRALTF